MSVDYPLGTVAIATVKGAAKVKVLRTELNEHPGWSFSPVPELGLIGNFAPDDANLVRDIEVIDTPTPEPERAPYDLSTMSARQIEFALIEILGEGGDPDEDYYDEFKGIDAFYHTLAGTSYQDHIKLPDSVTVGKRYGNVSLLVPALGEFYTVDKVTEYIAESGDADTFVVFSFNGKTYKKQSYLDSYEGGVWDGGIHEVKPVEKTIIVWEKP